MTQGSLFICLVGENVDGHTFAPQAVKAGASALLVSRHLREIDESIPQLIVSDTHKALLELGGHYRNLFKGLCVAVTGSCGKTTVKNMLAKIFQYKGLVLSPENSFNNNIGVPLTLLRLTESHQSAVLELGANAEGEIKELVQLSSPQVVLINNAMRAHLGGFKSLQGVADAKGEILGSLDATGSAVLPLASPFFDQWSQVVRDRGASLITFGTGSESNPETHPEDPITKPDVWLQEYCATTHTATIMTPHGAISLTIPLLGEHNAYNATAACAVALAAEVPLSAIKEGLESTQPAKHRLHAVELGSSLTLLDDSYNANPDAMRSALAVLAAYPAEQKVAVLADMGELGTYSQDCHQEVLETARNCGVQAITFGPEFAQITADHGYARKFTSYEDLVDCVDGLIEQHYEHNLGHNLGQHRVQNPEPNPEPNPERNLVLLLKGSRAMQLDRLVEYLKEKHGD